MKIQIEADGKKTYVLKKWILTRILFYACLAFCAFTFAFKLVFNIINGKDVNMFIHDAVVPAIALAFLFVPFFMERVFHWYIPNLIVLCCYFIVAMNMLGGEVWGLFSNLFLFDKVMHTFNGAAFMFFGFSLIGMLCRMPMRERGLPVAVIVLFALLLSMFIEYCWEIFEFTLDTFTNTSMQNWSKDLVSLFPNAAGYYESLSPRGSAIVDTLLDMIVHLIGAMPFVVLSAVQLKKQGIAWLVRVSVLSRSQTEYLVAQNALSVGEQDSWRHLSGTV